MKQSIRGLWLIACAALILLVVLAWVRSYSYASGPGLRIEKENAYAIVLDNGQLYFEKSKVVHVGSKLQWANVPATVFRAQQDRRAIIPGISIGRGSDEKFVSISMVYLVLISSLPFLRMFLKMQRHWMAAELCPSCGYELRRRHTRCPRCMTLIDRGMPVKTYRYPATGKAS